MQSYEHMSKARPVEGGVPPRSPNGKTKFHRSDLANEQSWAGGPMQFNRTTLPTAPCWRCGARAGCDHRSADDF